MPYQTNLLGDFWTSYRQRRATGGRPLTSGEMRGLLSPLASAEASKAIAAGEREAAQRRFDMSYNLQKTAMDRQQSAATMSGLIQLPLSYGVAKQSGLIPQSFNLLKPSTWGGAANTGAAAAPAANAVTSTLPASAPAGIQQSVRLAGDIAGPATAGLNYAAGLGPGLLGAGAGFGVSKLLGANEDITQAVTGISGGAAAGFAIAGPVGAFFGGLIGAGLSFLDDIF